MVNDNLSLMGKVREAANAVPDPCSMARNLNLGVADMGMIRDIRLEELSSGRWSVTMLIRLTAPSCMYMPYFEEHLRREVTRLSEVDEFRIVWDDNFDWTPEDLSPAAKKKVVDRIRRLEEVLRDTEHANRGANDRGKGRQNKISTREVKESAMSNLPSGFEDLEPLVTKWSKPTERERNLVRIESTIEELDDFYQKIFPRIEEVLGFLNQQDLRELSAEEKSLLFLALSLAEVAPSVELFRTPEVPDGFDSRRFVRVHVAHQTPDISPA